MIPARLRAGALSRKVSTMADNPQPRPAPGAQQSAASAQGRTVKAIAQQRLAILRRSILISSVVGFGALAALAAQHQVGVASHDTSAQSSTQSGAQHATTSTPDNGFFSQGNGDDQGSDDQGNDGDQGGYGFGQNTAPQQPLTGSSAS